jgi:response regulator NasT
MRTDRSDTRLVTETADGADAVDQRLRVLIANESPARVATITHVLAHLGHGVVGHDLQAMTTGTVAAGEWPDVALVGLEPDGQHALNAISQIVDAGWCPVVVVLPSGDPAYVRQAARRGAYCAIASTHRDDLQTAIDVAVHRFREYNALQGLLSRRAVIEQAKGILMACHAVDGDEAFDLLRSHSQHEGQKIVEVAQAIVDIHPLLVGPRAQPRPRSADLAASTRRRGRPRT